MYKVSKHRGKHKLGNRTNRWSPKCRQTLTAQVAKSNFRQDKTRQDKTTLLHFLHVTVITDLAPQVAEANRGGPGTIKINEFC